MSDEIKLVFILDSQTKNNHALIRGHAQVGHKDIEWDHTKIWYGTILYRKKQNKTKIVNEKEKKIVNKNLRYV